MPRKTETHDGGNLGRIRRVAGAVKRLFARGRKSDAVQQAAEAAPRKAVPSKQPVSAQGRGAKRQADIPMDVIDRAYTPPMTSSKASFRSDGADHQQDQELPTTMADDRWKDEDRLTNKSGDPRIGTRGRTYEPGETRGESRE